jgi:subtilisin family serine protease
MRDELEPTYPLTLLVEVDEATGATRTRLQEIVDAALFTDARGERWRVQRFFERDTPARSTVEDVPEEGFYEVRGRIPVSPSYSIRSLGFELAAALARSLVGELAGTVTPDFPSTAFGAEDGHDDAVVEAAVDVPEAGGRRASVASWPIRVMHCREAWALPPRSPDGRSRGEGIVIGHPDSGYTYHRELADALDLTRDHDVIGRDNDAEDPLEKRRWWPFDSPGHGTSTASVIASTEAGAVLGAAPAATLVPIRAVRSVVQVSDGDVARAIERAVTAGAHVISMSLGGVGFYGGVHAAIRRARAAGVIVLAAAGTQVRIVVAPARFEECIAVAATDEASRPWSGSSRGDPVLISAPGHLVPIARASAGATADAPGAGLGTSSGTSYAVAHLAGVAALWLASWGRDELIGRYGPEGVQEAFEQILTTDGFVRPAGWDDRWGVGVVDALKVLVADLPDKATRAFEVVGAPVAPPPIVRLAELGLTGDAPPREGLARLLGCATSDVDELARCHGAELAYLHAEGELVEVPAGATRRGDVTAGRDLPPADAAEAVPAGPTRLRVMGTGAASPSLRALLDRD